MYIKQRGVALIEVLVTSVIIAIGLSGTAALLLKSVQSTNDSAQRSIGLWVVQDYMGRIRANPEGAHEFGYEIADTATDCSILPSQICADIYKDGSKVNATACNAIQMATFDTWISVCGIASNVIDNASEMLKDPKLGAKCVYEQDRDADGNPECLKYEVIMKWRAQVELSNGSTMTRDMEYGQVVEIN